MFASACNTCSFTLRDHILGVSKDRSLNSCVFLNHYVCHVPYCRHVSAAEGGDKLLYHDRIATLILRSSCDPDRMYQ